MAEESGRLVSGAFDWVKNTALKADTESMAVPARPEALPAAEAALAIPPVGERRQRNIIVGIAAAADNPASGGADRVLYALEFHPQYSVNPEDLRIHCSFEGSIKQSVEPFGPEYAKMPIAELLRKANGLLGRKASALAGEAEHGIKVKPEVAGEGEKASAATVKLERAGTLAKAAPQARTKAAARKNTPQAE